MDLIPLVLENLYRPGRNGLKYKLARKLELAALKNATHIIAISQTTADDVHSVLGVPRERITVTHLGIGEKFFDRNEDMDEEKIRAKFNFGDVPLVLYVGGIDQRKNIPVMFKIFREVVNDYEEKHGVPPLLVLAGDIEKDRHFPALIALRDKLNLGAYVKILGYLPDSELIELYRCSALFLFPSLYEGFGLPPLEAMAAGLAVVSSNRSVMPEVLGESALYFNPDDISEGASQVLHCLREESLRNELIVKGKEQARRFTWETTAKETLAVYRYIASLKKQSAVKSRI